MSYARWGSDSNVYVYEGSGGIVCCGCSLNENSQIYATARLALNHLEEHLKAGELVPNYTIEEIKQDHPDLDSLIVEND